jgi:hypothetical protein
LSNSGVTPSGGASAGEASKAAIASDDSDMTSITISSHLQKQRRRGRE